MSEERRGGRITEEILLAEGEEREKLTEMTKSQRRNHLPGGVIREIPVMRRVMPGQVTLRLLLLSRFSRVRLCAAPEMAAYRLPRPWDCPGKNTGVGCHFLLHRLRVKSESEVAQSCLTLRSHGLQPTRLLHPWDFPGRSTGVGCHCLLRSNLVKYLNSSFYFFVYIDLNLTDTPIFVIMHSFSPSIDLRLNLQSQN